MCQISLFHVCVWVTLPDFIRASVLLCLVFFVPADIVVSIQASGVYSLTGGGFWLATEVPIPRGLDILLPLMSGRIFNQVTGVRVCVCGYDFFRARVDWPAVRFE